MYIKSTLAQIASLVWEAQSAEEAREILIGHLQGSKIKDRDRMVANVSRLTSLEAIHRYTANALLKYEGMGVA